MEAIDNPMHEAAKRGNIPFLQECLANGVSVNGLDKAGATPLYWAAHGGHTECVEILLGVPNMAIDAQNKLGDTALHACAWKGHADCVKLLLDKCKSTSPHIAKRRATCTYFNHQFKFRCKSQYKKHRWKNSVPISKKPCMWCSTTESG